MPIIGRDTSMKRTRILLVDDEPLSSLHTATSLRTRGYSVSTVSSGEAAVKLVSEVATELDLILMDISLGDGMDGFQAATAILKLREIPIIFLSVHSDDEIIAKASSIGSYGFVAKGEGSGLLDASIRMAIRLFEAQSGLARANEELQDSIEKLSAVNEAFAQSEGRFARLFELNPDAIVIGRLEDGAFIDVNERFRYLLGYERAEVLGKTSLDLGLWLNPSERADYLSAIAEEGIVNGIEAGFRRKDGSIITVSVSGRVMDMDGEKRIFSALHDITEKKKAEAELEHLVAEKEMLMKELQHRVKNNLNVVVSLLSLEEEKCRDEAARAALSNAISRVGAIAEIYERLYASKDLSSIDLGPYAEELACALFETYNIAPSRIAIKTEFGQLRLDTKRCVPFGLILNELVSNALKYAYPGSEKGEVRVALRSSGGEALLIVEDDGQGVPEEYRGEATDGMGMTLVRMLAQQLGGGFELDCARGTRAQIRFPISGPDAS